MLYSGGMIQGAAFRVLACFYDQDSRSFVDICERAGYPTDLGGYYLRQLVTGEYVQKIDRGNYGITAKGKQQLAFHYGKRFFALYPRLMVAFIAKNADNFMVLQRTVQPFLDTYEWPAGRVAMGESLADATQRLASQRLGNAVPEQAFCGFFRRIDTYDGTVFDDKLFAVYTCTMPDEAAVNAAPYTGAITLQTRAQLDALERPSKSLLDILAFSEQPDLPMVEKTYDLVMADF
jgi:hypothetical protein